MEGMNQQKQTLFMEAYASCHDPFIRYCSALAYNKIELEDLVQDVLVTAYEQFENIRKKDRLLHYLIRAARNRAISTWRRSKQREGLQEAHPSWCRPGTTSPEVILDIQLLYQLMTKLPDEQKDAILLFEISGFSMKEIAEIQRSTVGAVKTRISRGRSSLRKMIEEKPESKSLLGLLLFLRDPISDEGFRSQRINDSLQKLPPKIEQEEIAKMINALPDGAMTNKAWFSRINFTPLVVGAIGLAILVMVLFNFLPGAPLTTGTDTSVSVESPQPDNLALANGFPNSVDNPLPASSEPVKALLKGVVLDPDAEGLYLLKVTQDTRGEKVRIPVVNGAFEYELVTDHEEAFQLIYTHELDMAGAWRPIVFFAEPGEIDFVLQESQRADENKIEGGELNRLWTEFQTLFETKFYGQYAPIQAKMRELFQNDEYSSDSMKVLLQAVRDPKDEKERTDLGRKITALRDEGLHLSPKAKVLDDQRKIIDQKALDWRYDYISNNPSIMSYYLLYQDLKRSGENNGNIGEMAVAFEEFKKLYPEHPYTNIIREMIFSFKAIKVGGVYEDFIAPDLQGVEHQLSDLKKGKILVLDLWASWCRPCLQKSRELIPVYRDYNGPDFTVVGVAREFKNTERLEKTLTREQYPWMNLLELDDQNEIWLKYKIPFSGGGIFLIDREGEILAIEPTAEEVRKILEDQGIPKTKR